MVLVLVEDNAGETASLWRSERGAWVMVDPGEALVAFARARRFRYSVSGRWKAIQDLSIELIALTDFQANPIVTPGSEYCRIELPVPTLLGHNPDAVIGQLPVRAFDKVRAGWVVEIKLALA